MAMRIVHAFPLRALKKSQYDAFGNLTMDLSRLLLIDDFAAGCPCCAARPDAYSQAAMYDLSTVDLQALSACRSTPGAKPWKSIARGVATMALAVALSLPTVPLAQAVEAQSPMPVAAMIDGRRIDAFGVLPGMTPEQVRGILEPMGFAEKDKNEKELN